LTGDSEPPERPEDGQLGLGERGAVGDGGEPFLCGHPLIIRPAGVAGARARKPGRRA
jgi:hypothetical protein